MKGMTCTENKNILNRLGEETKSQNKAFDIIIFFNQK